MTVPVGLFGSLSVILCGTVLLGRGFFPSTGMLSPCAVQHREKNVGQASMVQR
jgi:hypothetical protein